MPFLVILFLVIFAWLLPPDMIGKGYYLVLIPSAVVIGWIGWKSGD